MLLKTTSGAAGKAHTAPGKVIKQDVLEKNGTFTGKYAASSTAQAHANEHANLGAKAKMKGRMGTR